MLQATTELEAVNLILEMVEEAPVNTITGTIDPDARAALNALSESSRAIQSKGWEFNREAEYTLSVGNDGFIQVPPDIISLTATDGRRLSVKGGRLYDRDAKSYRFTEDVKASVILLLDFPDLSEAARTYILTTACMKFLARRGGGDLIARVTSADLEEAKSAFIAEDIRAEAASFSHHEAIQNRPRP